MVHSIIISKQILFSLMFDLVLVNNVDPDEMSHYAAVHLELHCLPKYPFRGFGLKRVYNIDKLYQV